MKRWLCMDCRNVMELDKHGRCEHCDSEAVDLKEPGDGLTHAGSAAQAGASSSGACA